MPSNPRQFGCRHCYGVTYQSRRRTARDPAIVKAYNIRERLFPKRPPRMWRRTYERLRKEGEEAAAKYRTAAFPAYLTCWEAMARARTKELAAIYAVKLE